MSEPSELASDQARAQLEALLGTAADGIIVINNKGLIEVYNKACERLFGYGENEVLGQNVKMLMPAPYRQEHDDYLHNYQDTGKRKIIGIGREVKGRRKDGTTFPMYLSVGEGRRGNERIFVGIIHDLTEQRRIADELREREARLNSILDTGPDAIIMIDDRGMIELFNSAAARLFGYTGAETIGQNVNMLMPNPYHDQHDGYLQHYKDTREKRIIGIGRVVVARRRDGTTFPMELAVGEVQVGDRRMFTGFIRDITERKETENRLQDLQSELLHVARLNAMGQMASAIAHELNQPLAAMANYLSAATRTLQGLADPKLARSLDLIEKANAQTARAGQIIRRLRAFIEKDDAVHSHESLNKAVEEAIAISLVSAADTKIKLTVDFHPDLPPVYIDKVQIQQVVLNLVRNSIEAMQDSSRRELLVSTAKLDDASVIVTVSDTGPGLTPEVAERLFQPFVTTKAKGMGVGLSISHTIIESHRGRIWAEPKAEGGTVFRFTLPIEGEKSVVS